MPKLARKVSKTKAKPRRKNSAQPELLPNTDGNGSSNTSRAKLSSLIKSARDIMRKDAGLNGDLDRLPQFSWVLFLKCFDDLELRREAEAAMAGNKATTIIPKGYRWRDWAADPDKGRTGPELIDFINNDLLPKLRTLNGAEERQVIAAVFGETYNRMLSGYLLRDVVNLVNGVNFNSSDDIFTLGHLYESMLKEMRDAAGDSGEFYTPRPVVRCIVDRVAPKIGDRIGVAQPAP
jgi:type I restriction enzyme M protein